MQEGMGISPNAGLIAAALDAQYSVLVAAKQISAIKEQGEQAIKLIESATVPPPNVTHPLDLKT